MSSLGKVILGVGAVVGVVALSSSGSSEPVQDTQSSQRCHPSYSGCLKPNSGDYDCRGGSGNGPNYTGRVRVTGPDTFGLDRDGDGWGCE